MVASGSRAQWLDRLRGLAAIGMVVVHVTHAVLREELRATPGFRVADAAFGLVAPAFLFCVGAAFALHPSSRLGPRLLRASGLFVLGYAMHVSGLVGYVRSGGHDELALFLQADILQVIAIALAFLAVVARALPVSWPFASLALGALALVAGPFVAGPGARAPAALAPYLTYGVTTQFPLFPWLAYALVAAGVRGLPKPVSLARMGGVGVLVALALLFLPLPAHDAYRSGPAYAAVRFSVVAALGAAMGRVRVPSRVDSLLALLGRRSLFLYVVHVALVYGRNPVSLRSRIGPELGVVGVCMTVCATLAAMTALTWWWDRFRGSPKLPKSSRS
jgi:uncharacterized membrane protein